MYSHRRVNVYAVAGKKRKMQHEIYMLGNVI